MLIRTLITAILLSHAGLGTLRVQKLIEVPLQRAQTLNSLTADRDGKLIVTGFGVQGGFVSKLDSSGKVIFNFANSGSYPVGAATDGEGNVYWAGTGGAPGFPFPFTRTILPVKETGSLSPGFIVKFRSIDGAIIWAEKIEAIQPQAITVDPAGLVTLAGVATTSAGNVLTGGAYLSPSSGSVAPLVIARLNAAGDPIFAAAYGGHSINGVSTCIAPTPFFSCTSDPRTTAASIFLDQQQNIWVAGTTNETDLPVTRNALKLTCGCGLSSGDGYLAEFSSDGSALLYASYLGSSANDQITSAAMEPSSGRIWISGATNGTDLPTTADAYKTTRMGDTDGFLLEYDSAANKLVYGTYYGVQGTNSISHMAIRSDGIPVFSGHLNQNPANPYSSGHDFVAILKKSGIEQSNFLRNGADAGIVFSTPGIISVAGSGSVIVSLEESVSMQPSIFGLANSALLNASGQVSPGEICSIVGLNLGPDMPLTAPRPSGQETIATVLGGVQVLFNGVAAPLLYVSSTQINVLVPFGTADMPNTRLIVMNGGVSSTEARLGVVPAGPGIFTTQDTYQNLPLAAALNQDGTVNSAENRAAPGSTVSVFGTGFGNFALRPIDGALLTAPLPKLEPQVNVFGFGFVTLAYAGQAPNQVAGAIQVNFVVPADGSGTPPLLIFAGGWSAPRFTLWVTGR